MPPEPLRRRLLRLLVLLGLFVTLGPWVLAPAPRDSIQYVGLVLKKLDFTQPPNYPTDGFSLPGGAGRLSTDVEATLRVMADPTNSNPTTWCTMINDIFNNAT